MSRARALLAALGAASLLAVAGAPARAADVTAPELLDRVAPAIASVHAVFQVRVVFQGQTMFEQEMPAPGLAVVVDPTGLLAVGDAGHLTRAMEQGMQGLSVSLTPRSIKVTFAGDPEEHDAVLVVRDSTVGVAFLQVLGLGDRTLPFVDFAKAGETPRVGQDLLGVQRLGRGFDYAPEVQRLSVSQSILQPRRMWGLRGDFEQHGLPAFDKTGALVGLVTLQFGGEGIDMAAAAAARSVPVHFCLLPVEVIRPLVAAAKKRVPEAVEKARGDKEAAPAAGGGKEAPATDGGGMDAPGMDAPGMDAPGMDAPGMDAPGMDGGAMEGEAPPGKGAAPPG